MEDYAFKLLRLVGRREKLTPAKRVRDFQSKIQSLKNCEPVEIQGFLILKQPPYAPKDALYYILSPLSPSELKKAELRAYLILRLTENSKVNARFRSGEYVKVSGIIDSYPYGNLRMIHVESLESADYSDYWLEYEEMALSKRELEDLFMKTIYANYDLEKAVIYSLFASPIIVGAKKNWGEGVTFSVFKDEQKIILSVWEAMHYISSLLPRELQLRKDDKETFVDPELDLDFVLFDSNNTDLKYYVPYNKKILTREIPAPNWAIEHFENKNAVFLTPKKYSLLSPDDPLAYSSETPFILNEPIGYERNRELEDLIPNVIITIFKEREKIASLSAGDEVMRKFRDRFEHWIMRNRHEYGEKFDALRLKGMIFETNTRYLLSAHILGSIGRFEGKIDTGIINDVLVINQEILDLWMNELPEKVILRAVETYERYISRDKRANTALSIFMDLEATSIDGTVTREEFYRALLEYGFKEAYAKEIIDRLIAEGHLYEPFFGKLKMIKPE
ncbi:hypothetical protein E3E31_05580 [Thermococcus sp. M39]|uniref:hypothetical protein n=1 Tax=unclassified Thermococcus TaxID=2627626 RepID=UPI00143AD236|nr:MULTISPECIES: hypothetical protein [unclassified Thermococcus]NJE07997.1 hypothetical protein [Thermococcus sp. M39]NJE13699.1 hypothetical protein [Thermococcus sp. LS2]